MAPIVHGLEADYYGKIGFVYLDIDDPTNDNFKKQFGFTVRPEFFLVDVSGNILKNWIGPVTVEEFKLEFDKLSAGQ